jgi:anti-sigma B factor antagonist
MVGGQGEHDMTVTHRRVGAAAVVTVTGEVDLRTVPRLRAAIDQALADASADPVIVDLSAVVLLASAGLRALQDAHAGCVTRQAQPLRVVVDHNRPAIRPLQLTGLDQVMRLFYDVDEALRAGPSPTADPSPSPDPVG